MHPLLAQIYGTNGHTKTASDSNVIDLNQISAADFVAGIESGEIVLPDEGFDKEAGDDLDLSQMTGSELLELLDYVDGEGTFDKMASDGSAEYWDMAGRIMAHAYADEMHKVAGGDLPDEISLDDVDGDQMLALIESGEYELVDSFDKEASLAGPVRQGLQGLPFRARRAASSASERAGSYVGDTRVGKHYKGRSASARSRSAGLRRSLIRRAGTGKGGLRRDISDREMKIIDALSTAGGRAREYAPEIVGAGGLSAGSLATASHLRKKNQS